MLELFSIHTSGLRLVWSLRKARPVPVVPTVAAPPFGLSVVPAGGAPPPAVHVAAAPVTHLFEQTDYVLFVQSRAGRRVRVRHRDPVLLRGLHTSADGSVVHGVLNFGTQVGRSGFTVEVDGTPAFSFEVEVVPSKLDYRRDYEALRADVQDLTAALVLEYLRATYRGGDVLPTASADVPGWLMLLRLLLDDLGRALDHVARHPYRGTEQAPTPGRAEQARRPDTAVRHAIRRAAGGTRHALPDGLSVPARLPAQRSRYTLDTPEHRWLRDRLQHLHTRLGDLVDRERRGRSSPRRTQVLAELGDLQQRLVHLLKRTPLRDAGEVRPPEPTLRLQTAPGYREAYAACLALQRGLHLRGGPVDLSLKDLHLLYEYWCFLTLVRLAAARTGAPQPVARLVAVERDGLRLRLRRGHRHAVRLATRDGRRITLVYNPRFGGRGYLVPQQPDVVLTVRRADGSRARYILDAKYRLDASPAYVDRYGMPGPPTDALNTLHRYRDAILDHTAGGRTVVQAVALYPYREPAPGAFPASRLGRALSDVGVGALPFLPGATDHVEAWLEDVLR